MRWPFQVTVGLTSCWLLALLIFSCLLGRVACLHDVSEDSLSSFLYEWGFYGGYPKQSFKSSALRPPRMNTVQWDEQCASGFTLLTLRGTSVPKPTAVIIDGKGELVWMDESFGYIMNLKIQQYRGEQYLTFWSGSFGEGFGKGTYYMLDSHYQIFRQFTAAGAEESDFHEYTITADDTALLTSYDIIPADLSSLGVEGEGWIYDSKFREMDIETGEIIFEWRASDHFAVKDSFYPIGSAGRTPEHPYDFFHINSIDKDDDGNYIISSRFLHNVACISATTGRVIWELGGSRNDFTDVSDGAATDFAWQHHANFHKGGMISIFDNAKWKKWYSEIFELSHGEVSRGMLLSIDTDNMTVELVQEYLNPTMRGVPQQGSMQVLEDSDNVLVGWGYHGAYTEYSPNGEVLCDTHINPSVFFDYGFVHSYRAFRAATWVGRPKTQPAIYLKSGDDYAYVSWMGATEVDHWVLQTARDTTTDDLIFTDASVAEKDGFETAIEMPAEEFTYLRIIAMDKDGQVLATTETIRADRGTAGSSCTALAVFIGVLLGCCFVLSLVFHRRLRAILKASKQRLRSHYWFTRWEGSRFSTAKFELEPLYNG